MTVSGVAFLAFGLFAAQLFRTSRGANGISVAFVSPRTCFAASATPREHRRTTCCT